MYENDPRNPVNFSESTSECHYCGEQCDGDFCNNDCKKGYKNDMFTEKS